MAGVHLGTDLHTDLDYADDVVLFTNDSESLSTAVNKFHEETLTLGLHVS